MQEERRINPPKLDEELYKLDDLKTFIQKERRHDELERYMEVEKQKTTWKKTVFFCLFINLIFLTLGLIGMGIN